MTSEKAVFWLSVIVLLGFGLTLGQIAAAMVGAAAGCVLAVRNMMGPMPSAQGPTIKMI
jgi:hypothetical protein